MRKIASIILSSLLVLSLVLAVIISRKKQLHRHLLLKQSHIPPLLQWTTMKQEELRQKKALHLVAIS